MTKGEFATIIRERRKELKLRQTDLADMAGVGLRTLLELEKGNNFTFETLDKVLFVLGLDLKIEIKSL